MDVAASEFLTPEKMYDLDFKTENNDGSAVISPQELADLYASFCAEFPIVSIEDPYDQDDWANYTEFTAAIGDAPHVIKPPRRRPRRSPALACSRATTLRRPSTSASVTALS